MKFEGVIIVGGHGTNTKVEVFNPNTKMVCHLPDMSASAVAKSTLCGNLFCTAGSSYSRTCWKWVKELAWFVKTNVNLRQQRSSHICWSNDNGVLLLGGAYSSKERFKC